MARIIRLPPLPHRLLQPHKPRIPIHHPFRPLSSFNRPPRRHLPISTSTLLPHSNHHSTLLPPSTHHYPRPYSTTPPPSSSQPSPSPSPSSEPKPYTYELLSALSAHPSPHRLIIDVREPSELKETGRVPGALNVPINSNPDAFFLDEESFEGRFGFVRPRARVGGREGVSGRKGEGISGREGGEGSNGMGKSPFTPEMKSREARAGLNAADKEDTDVGEGRGGQGEGEGQGEGDGVDEVIFYCKAGVRSRAAARLAREWKGVKIGDMDGGWNEWSSRGGKVER